ncbi:MAG: hypothetical protein HYU88_02840 [Chloroflexi bacterium]|nr:hypothetical protein [Chloroflexota bacterium]MBI4506842.1 hypothetical protein [Chloroflexota bacterium]
MAVDRGVPPEVEQAIQTVLRSESPEHASALLANMANRVVAELHKLARTQANEQRGKPQWGRWAALVNASRDAVLKLSMCRETAAELAGKAPRARRAPSRAEAGPPGGG